MNYSLFIYNLLRVLRGFGWRVNPHAKFDSPVVGLCTVGRCYYDSKRIEMNCASAREALLTLAHESGHAMAFSRGGQTYLARPLQRREALAYLYGWAVLYTLGAPITKAEWRHWHEDLLETFNARQATATTARNPASPQEI